MKSRVKFLLCSALLLLSFQSPSAQNLLEDPRISLQREINLDAPALNSEPELLSERSQSTSKFVTVDGTRLHFVINGKGQPVVLIHGNPGSGQDWTRMFTPLATHHEVIAFDRPVQVPPQTPKSAAPTAQVLPAFSPTPP